MSAATLAYYCGIAAQASAKATLGCFTAFAHTNLRNDLAAITVPTLIIRGDSDAVFPYEARGARAYRAIAGSEAVIPGGSHSVNMTPPPVQPALLDFLPPELACRTDSLISNELRAWSRVGRAGPGRGMR